VDNYPELPGGDPWSDAYELYGRSILGRCHAVPDALKGVDSGVEVDVLHQHEVGVERRHDEDPDSACSQRHGNRADDPDLVECEWTHDG